MLAWHHKAQVLSLALQNKMYLGDTKAYLVSRFARINCHVPKESAKALALSISSSSSNFINSILFSLRVGRERCLLNRIVNEGWSQKSVSQICSSPTLPWFTFHKYLLRNMFLHIFIHVMKPRTRAQTLWLIQESLKPQKNWFDLGNLR